MRDSGKRVVAAGVAMALHLGLAWGFLQSLRADESPESSANGAHTGAPSGSEASLPRAPYPLYEIGNGQRGNEDFSPPHPDPDAQVATSAFARRAGIAPGTAARVLVTVDISRHGRVERVDVTASSGNIAADAAAGDYVRALTWIPARVSGVPANMRIRFPVILEDNVKR
jgi:TonB family protein